METKAVTQVQTTPLTIESVSLAVEKYKSDINKTEQQRTEILKLCSLITTVPTSQVELEVATNRVREIARLEKLVETTRKAVKEPVRILASRVDEIAEAFCAPLLVEKERLNGDPKKGTKGLIGIYIAQEEERVKKEQEALDAERRQKEKEAADAAREQERLANLAKPQPKKEVAAEVKVEQTKTALRQVQAAVVVAPSRASGLTVKHPIDFEITDDAALYAVRPEFFTLEPRRSVIKAAINKNTKLPGLRVWEETKTSVRT